VVSESLVRMTWKSLVLLVAVLAMTQLGSACYGPQCGDDPAYRYDPKTGTCIDLSEEYGHRWDEMHATEAAQDWADWVGIQAQATYEAERSREVATEDAALQAADEAASAEGRSCTIRGNISKKTGEKIYHVPGCDYYEQTRIDPNRGERWFCTEDEAVAAGWRKAYNCP